MKEELQMILDWLKHPNTDKPKPSHHEISVFVKYVNQLFIDQALRYGEVKAVPEIVNVMEWLEGMAKHD